MEAKIKETTIKANLTILQDLLHNAAVRMDEAIEYLDDGNINASIGRIIDLDQLLETALNVQKAALFLHRLG